MNPTVSREIKTSNGIVWMMKSGQTYQRTPFSYHVDIGTEAAAIASGATSTGSVTIQSDSHFLCRSILFSCFDTTAHTNITAPNTTIQITDAGSGTNLFDAQLQLILVAGTASLPGLLLTPRLFKPAATVTVTLTNVQSTNAQKYEIVLQGEKIFDYTGES